MARLMARPGYWSRRNTTPNKAGAVTDYCILRIYTGQKNAASRFYITNLGDDRLILGYPWLRHFNPSVNWEEGIVKEAPVRLETPWYKFQKWKEACIAKTNYAQEWAIAAHKKEKELTAQDVPEKYSQHYRVHLPFPATSTNAAFPLEVGGLQ